MILLFPYRKFLFFTLLSSMVLLPAALFGQFVKGFGLMAGAQSSRQIWFGETPVPARTTGFWSLGPNAALMIELGRHEFFRWQSEFQWMPKNSRLAGVPSRLGFVNWGNFLKVRQELYDVTPFLLAGVKTEYPYIGPPGSVLTASLSAGLGIEILIWRPVIMVLDAGYDYNPIDAVSTASQSARTRAVWIRLGIKREVRPKSKSCFPRGTPPMIQ